MREGPRRLDAELSEGVGMNGDGKTKLDLHLIAFFGIF